MGRQMDLQGSLANQPSLVGQAPGQWETLSQNKTSSSFEEQQLRLPFALPHTHTAMFICEHTCIHTQSHGLLKSHKEQQQI